MPADERHPSPVAAGLRRAEELQFTTHDGQPLFYRRWPATQPRRGAVLLFHRGHEHSGRVAHLVDELALPDFDFYAWDARGHGRSPGARGFSPSFGTSVRDVQTFVDHIVATHGVAMSDVHVVAQSVGAVLAATWAHDYAPRIRGLHARLAGLQGQALRALRAPPGWRCCTACSGTSSSTAT